MVPRPRAGEPGPGGRAVFLDRDGTLIVDRHYLGDPEGVELLPGAREGIHRLRELGYRLFLFTNQSGIGRGWITREQVDACNRRTEERLGLAEGFAGIGIAPERPDEPAVYRKPSPRYLRECVDRFHLDPAACWMVGDQPRDVEAGRAAGMGVARILAEGERCPETGAPAFPDLAAFARWRAEEETGRTGGDHG